MLVRELARTPAGLVGSVLVAGFLLMAIFAPLIAPHGPFELSQPSLASPGSGGALFGSDQLGRDIFSQVVHGTRVAFIVGVLAAATSIALGMIIGAVSGYFGGRVDDLLMRTAEVFQVTPRFILALAMVSILGPGLEKVIFVIGFLSWPQAARVIRAQFLSLREQEFAEASRLLGLSHARIMFRELLPNAAPAAVVIGSLEIAHAILVEAGLSFLGLGDPDVMSWGVMLNNAQSVLHQAPWMSVFPGMAVFLLVLAFNLLGDGINEMLDPKQRVTRGRR